MAKQKQRKKIQNKVCDKQSLAYLELLVIWPLRKAGKESGKLPYSIHLPTGTWNWHVPLVLSSGDMHSFSWILTELVKGVTVPVTRACRLPRSCRWHCTGRWQTGQHSLPHSESSGSAEFWLHGEKQWKILRVEICNSYVSFGSICNFGAFHCVYFWRK